MNNRKDENQKQAYLEKIEEIKNQLNYADAIVIGGGSGLSTAAGLTYSGERFENFFTEFIKNYGFTDMYSAGFYPFDTQEERWAYWSKHIYCNRYDIDAGRVYKVLLELVKGKNYFVLTTNVDHQFWLANFDDNRIFATQGDYGYFQCAHKCHDKLYNNEEAVRKMLEYQKGCKIPTHLIPKCPVCGGDMSVNLRCDNFFAEDEKWHIARKKYEEFLKENKSKKILFIELGVGMNTPVIIKYPFWKMTAAYKNASYVCINKGEAW
ncbi:MAG: Sir2 silent information regulator family NAD-dependent deacetylase, partial [Lachnospiraceae bacterium]|nr:Sir2 silent information regulator family NAD-dependent deacetylase [Lachnospiraceae bacterium]